MNNTYIYGFKRTAIGAFRGTLSKFPATELGSIVIKSLLEENNINVEKIEEVIMGNVLSAGQGQAPARQAAISAGLPNKVECFTINKMCGSGLKSVMLASHAIQAGDAEIIIAGGMENMSKAPYLLLNNRKGLRLGHDQILDSMIVDGLWDVYNDKHMGECAETCASDKKYNRESQDLFAQESYSRAQAAQSKGAFQNEIVPLVIDQKKGDSIAIKKDEDPDKANFEKMKLLKPVFKENGTITAANASKINDGAAALLLMTRDKAKEIGLEVMATIISQSSSAHDPEWFTTAPAKALPIALSKAGISKSDVDFYELNEAFSVVGLANIKILEIDEKKVNINGGAVSLGHPLGNSGSRIIVTLINILQQNKGKIGAAGICNGGGGASAMVLELI